MTGGGLLYGLDKLLEDRLKIKINVVDDPVLCRHRTGKALEDIDLYTDTPVLIVDKKTIEAWMIVV